MKRLFLVFICLSIGFSGFSQIMTIPFKDNAEPLEGNVYFLPKTIFVVEVQTKCTKETPGQYFQYAERFLGLTNVCQTEKNNNEIISVKIIAKSVPDLQNSFILKSKKSGKSETRLELTKDGFLKSINGEPAVPEIQKRSFQNTYKPTLAAYQTMETSIITKEMQQSSSTARIAELAAAELFNIRDTRINILIQDVDKTPSDGRSYEIVLSELNRLEKYYSELFAGKREEKTETFTFEVEPKESAESIIFRFSQTQGVISKTDLSGSPVYIKISKEQGLAVANKSAGKAKKYESVSLFYRVPGKAKVTVTDGIKTFYDDELTVPQFGTVLTLPYKEYKIIELCPLTGALLKVTE